MSSSTESVSRPAPPRLMWSVVEEHLDEAEFLWGLWERALLAPQYTLDEVAAGPEERLQAHLDGLVVNGPEVGRRLLIPALEDDEPERVTAAAAALLQVSGDVGVAAVFEALHELPEQRPALVRALECADRPESMLRARALLHDDDLEIVTAAAEVLAFHHEPLDEVLGVLLMSEASAARVLGLRSLATMGDPGSYRRAVEAGLVDADLEVVGAAMEVGALLGLASAWARVRERAQLPGGALPMLLLALAGSPTDRALLVSALNHPRRRADAMWALGFDGTPEAVDAALEWLDDDVAGPLAGEVFSAVTGVDLVARRMRLPARPAESVRRSPADDLPRPDPMPILRWWTQHRGEFRDGVRYIDGAPRELAGLITALERGAMRRRPGLLLDLQLRSPPSRRPRLQLRAPSRRQRRELSGIAGLRTAPVDVHRALA